MAIQSLRRRPAPALRRIAVTLLGLLLAACSTSTSQYVGLVSVVNLSDSTGSFQWQSTGDAASGSESIGACRLYVHGFDPGDQQISITASGQTQSLVFNVPAPGSGSQQTQIWFVIGRDGQITQTTKDAAPASPYCSQSV